MLEVIKSLNWHKIILYAALGVCLYILFTGKCSKVKKEPVYVTVHDQQTVIQKDEKEIKRIKDSFELVLNKHYKDDDKDYSDYLDLLNENDKLQGDILLFSKTVPDTCKPFVDKYNRYVTQTNKALSASKTSINGLQNTVSVQKKYLAAKDTALNTIRRERDTCLAQQAILEKYPKSIKPKREISISALAQSSYIQPYKLAAGIGIGYRNRKGIELNLAVYTNQTINIGIKKPLFRF